MLSAKAGIRDAPPDAQAATDGDLGGIRIIFVGTMTIAAVDIELDHVNTVNGFLVQAQNTRLNFGGDAVGANDRMLMAVARRQVADRQWDRTAIGAGFPDISNCSGRLLDGLPEGEEIARTLELDRVVVGPRKGHGRGRET